MSKKPKLETVAKEAGVSVATASQVMRGAGRISELTRKKVRLAAKKLNYVPDGRAAAMRSGENREIGLSIHKIANPFNAEIISGASDLFESEGYLLSVLDARDDAERQRNQLEAFIRSTRGGVLWVPAEDTPKSTFELLTTHQLPSVTFLRRSEFADLDHIGIENAKATAEATHHLAELGHRRIAFLGGTARVAVRSERIEGYTSALAQLGLGAPIVWDCEDGRVAGMQAMDEIRRQHPDVTALVCNGDMVAIGACLALQRRGEMPGREVSVVGFDDIQDAELAVPPLTTMAVSPYMLGRKLARVMLERIREPDMPITVSHVPARMVLRETTKPPMQR
ncbi:Transcriptional regulator, LacI family [Candidatus Rhodobacter oscarellae]|uniref:Transcriptional regulator, LacI family n=1 Tax=Candidatus Rhodobacter oscarellae TaxID=1675527 RepID=A0A0J9E268_9RHOB|nr:LacI family DNA-binding transcriptional regulator [Candidatus Rhodobacter lobularis]KMW56825.1 Transcriptional regulator, LacI family [Candidatus Rhodobacter lobularis]